MGTVLENDMMGLEKRLAPLQRVQQSLLVEPVTAEQLVEHIGNGRRKLGIVHLVTRDGYDYDTIQAHRDHRAAPELQEQLADLDLNRVPGYHELMLSMREQYAENPLDFLRKPFVLDLAYLSGMRAKGFFVPYVRGRNLKINHAVVPGFGAPEGSLQNAQGIDTNFASGDFTGTDMSRMKITFETVFADSIVRIGGERPTSLPYNYIPRLQRIGFKLDGEGLRKLPSREEILRGYTAPNRREPIYSYRYRPEPL